MASQQPAWAPTARPDLRAFVPQQRRTGPLLLWLVCLAGGVALLVWLGDGRLAAPDVTAPSTWTAWARDRGTAAAVVALLRIVALGLAWYLVGVTAVSVLAHAARAARLVRVADALSFGPVRTVVQQALGVSLAAGVLASALPAAAWGGGGVGAGPVATAPVASVVADDVEIGAPADGRPADDGHRAARRASGTAVEVMVPVPGPAVGARGVDIGDDATGAAGAVDAAGAVEGGGTSGDARRVHRVRAGDHLWGIAEDDLRSSLGRDPTEAEVHDHWERVVEVNRDDLVVPSNPDLLRPGQTIVLPDHGAET